MTSRIPDIRAKMGKEEEKERERNRLLFKLGEITKKEFLENIHAISTKYHGKVERCVDCGKEIPGIQAPAEHPEISGSLVCAECVQKEFPGLSEFAGVLNRAAGSKKREE